MEQIHNGGCVMRTPNTSFKQGSWNRFRENRFQTHPPRSAPRKIEKQSNPLRSGLLCQTIPISAGVEKIEAAGKQLRGGSLSFRVKGKVIRGGSDFGVEWSLRVLAYFNRRFTIIALSSIKEASIRPI